MNIIDRLMADCDVKTLDEKGIERMRSIVDGFLRQGGSFGWDSWVQFTEEARAVITDCANRIALERAAVAANLFWIGPKGIAEAVSPLDGGKAKMLSLLEESVKRMVEGDRKPEGAV